MLSSTLLALGTVAVLGSAAFAYAWRSLPLPQHPSRPAEPTKPSAPVPDRAPGKNRTPPSNSLMHAGDTDVRP
jgi:hypothetical protein